MTPFTLGTMRALDSPAQMAAVLQAAVQAGIRHLETAPAYGPAEAFLGEALQRLERRDPALRRQLVLTSKLLPGCSLEQGQAQLRALLARLASPQLDNLAVHGLNTPEHLDWALRGDGRDLLAWAEAEGLVGQVGFSSHGATPLIEQALASRRFGFCSLHLHLFDRERLPLARAALAGGIGVMAISPADKGGRLYDPPPELLADCAPFHPLELAYRFLLDQGISTLTLGAAQPGDLAWAAALLADPGGEGGCGRFSPEDPGLSSAPAAAGGGGDGHGSSAAALEAAESAAGAAADAEDRLAFRPAGLSGAGGPGDGLCGAAPVQPPGTALVPAAQAARPAMPSGDSGAGDPFAGLAVAAAASREGPWLGPEQRAALARLEAAGRGRLAESRCGQCRQCLPCPNEVPIPALLRLRNLAVGHGMVPFASERYSLIGRAGHWWEQLDASACQRCGDCLPRCPLQLPIPDLLADTHRRLAAPPRRRLWG